MAGQWRIQHLLSQASIGYFFKRCRCEFFGIFLAKAFSGTHICTKTIFGLTPVAELTTLPETQIP